MADKSLLNDTIAIKLPLTAVDEGSSTIDEPPPSYQYPQIDFSSGWKDRGFAIVFWLYVIAEITVGLVLSMPIVLSYVKHSILNRQERTSFESNTMLFVYALSSAAAAGGFISFIIFFLLQQCAGRIIRCSLILVVIIEVVLGVVFLFMVSWVACIGPFVISLITLVFIWCIRKRIPFAEAHLQVGYAALQRHPSLMFVALIMLVVEFLWLALWCLMLLGIEHASNRSIIYSNINTKIITDESHMKALMNTKAALIETSISKIRSTTYLINEKSHRFNTTRNALTHRQNLYRHTGVCIILFVLLLSWCWGAITFANVVHFITTCTVGQWWFTADTDQQYVVWTSFKRAFTTNFGTICFGSLLEAIIKALRTCEKNKNRKKLLALCAWCILRIHEKLIDYINEWAFIYAALTGQSYIEASQSFTDLFRKRGWTMIINDHLVEHCLMMINIVVGCASASVGGLIVYTFKRDSSEETEGAIIVIAIISFLIGVLLSTSITTILSSCIRTVFVCFALNPVTLGAIRPEHLQSLTKVWHKVHPEEFTISGYDYHLPKSISANNIQNL